MIAEIYKWRIAARAAHAAKDTNKLHDLAAKAWNVKAYGLAADIRVMIESLQKGSFINA
jgi:hypothetical protein